LLPWPLTPGGTVFASIGLSPLLFGDALVAGEAGLSVSLVQPPVATRAVTRAMAASLERGEGDRIPTLVPGQQDEEP
jgi:hypothetical protein